MLLFSSPFFPQHPSTAAAVIKNLEKTGEKKKQKEPEKRQPYIDAGRHTRPCIAERGYAYSIFWQRRRRQQQQHLQAYTRCLSLLLLLLSHGWLHCCQQIPQWLPLKYEIRLGQLVGARTFRHGCPTICLVIEYTGSLRCCCCWLCLMAAGTAPHVRQHFHTFFSSCAQATPPPPPCVWLREIGCNYAIQGVSTAQLILLI